MAISRVTTWIAGQVLTASALNQEIDNLINNALAAVSPLTGTLDANQQQVSNLRLENRTTNPSTGNAGRVWWRTDLNAIGGDTGGAVAYVPSMQGLAKGSVIAASGATGYSMLAVGTNGKAIIADSTTATGLGYGDTANVIQVQVFS